MTQVPRDCDNEIVSKIGAIQNFGTLFVADENLNVVQVSENVKHWLHLLPELVLGTNLDRFLKPRQLEALMEFGENNTDCPLVPVNVTFSGGEGKLLANAVAHKSDGFLILELERVDRDTADSSAEVASELKKAVEMLRTTGSTSAMLNTVAAAVKSIAGYDRVMIYKFHADLHGEVVVDLHEPGMDAYIGLHYPASDIPQPARHLFAVNWTRIIVNVDDAPILLIPSETPTGTKLDMTRSVLRQPAAVHVEYLKNMGVKASLTVSLIVDGKLWGLIACHHRTPRHVSYWIRSLCEFLGKYASLQIQQLQLLQRVESKATVEHICAQIITEGESDALGSLFRQPTSILTQLHAESMAFVSANVTMRSGAAPAIDSLRMFCQWLEAQPISYQYSTDRLSLVHMNVEWKDAEPAGVLAARCADGWLLLFRQEYLREVSWAGDPDGSFVTDVDGRMHPRRSFAVWRETVSGQSLPWGEQETASIGTLVDVITAATRAREGVSTIRKDVEGNMSSFNLRRALERTVDLLRVCLADAALENEQKSRIEIIARQCETLLHLLEQDCH